MSYSIFRKNAEGETETQAVDEWAYREWLTNNAPRELSAEKRAMWIEHQMHTAKMNTNKRKGQTFNLDKADG